MIATAKKNRCAFLCFILCSVIMNCAFIESRADCPGFLSIDQNPFPDTLEVAVGNIYRSSLVDPPIFVHSENNAFQVTASSENWRVVNVNMTSLQDSVIIESVLPGEIRIEVSAETGSADCQMGVGLSFIVNSNG